MKTCLVLEGGALRGIYTAGVIDSLLDETFTFDAIIGVSMGSLVGINYCSKQKGRAIRYNKKYCHDGNYIGWRSFFKTGDMVNKQLAYYDIPEKLDPFDYKAFDQSKTKLFCTVTNVDTGKAEYIEITDSKEQVELLRAGASMPGVSKIVEVDGKHYLDGGIADSIPVEKALSMGFDRVVVVLTRPIEYRKKDSQMKLMASRYKNYPKLQETIHNRNKNYNAEVEKVIELEKEQKIFVIRPTQDLKIKRIEHDPKKVQAQYDLGVKDYEAKRKELLKFLGEGK